MISTIGMVHITVPPLPVHYCIIFTSRRFETHLCAESHRIFRQSTVRFYNPNWSVGWLRLLRRCCSLCNATTATAAKVVGLFNEEKLCLSCDDDWAMAASCWSLYCYCWLHTHTDKYCWSSSLLLLSMVIAAAKETGCAFVVFEFSTQKKAADVATEHLFSVYLFVENWRTIASLSCICGGEIDFWHSDWLLFGLFFCSLGTVCVHTTIFTAKCNFSSDFPQTHAHSHIKPPPPYRRAHMESHRQPRHRLITGTNCKFCLPRFFSFLSCLPPCRQQKCTLLTAFSGVHCPHLPALLFHRPPPCLDPQSANFLNTQSSHFSTNFQLWKVCGNSEKNKVPP